MTSTLFALALATTLAAAPQTPAVATQPAPATEPAADDGRAAAEAPAATAPQAATAAPEPAAEPATAAAPEPAAAPPAAGPRSEEVTYANGKLPLAGLLRLPKGPWPVPAAVLVQGPDGGARTDAWAQAVADALVAEGLAVLVTERRGSGGSGGDWRAAGFGDLAGDALEAVKLLRGRPEVDPARIGLVALSQASWIVPVAAAARPEEVAWVIDLSGTAVSFAEQRVFELAGSARRAGLGEAQAGEVLALNHLAIGYLLTRQWDPYGQALQRALAGPWSEIAKGFPPSEEDPLWNFLLRVVSSDPMLYWLQLPQPVLAIYGADDEGDRVPVAESVRRLQFAFGTVGKDNARIVVVPGAGHQLLDPEGHALLPAVTTALSGWVAGNVLATH
jgi:uncharacterized protein